MPNVTNFDTEERYILLPVFILAKDGKRYEFDALLDSGAPATEFSDASLQYLGFIETPRDNVKIKPGMQTQKYGKTILPEIEICSHSIKDLPVYISHFDKSWGIDALIGLDFFRQFKVTVDYKKACLITESL